MIGFVISRPAAVTVADVTPLSRWYVWRVKATMIFDALTSGEKMLLTIQAVCTELVIAMAFVSQSIALVPASLICAWNLYNLIQSTFIKPATYSPRWRTSLLSEDMEYVDEWSVYQDIPVDAARIAARVRAIGLTPEVEYFDEDPFLFVEVGGQRVYLYHWV